jgi:hypothetical protein
MPFSFILGCLAHILSTLNEFKKLSGNFLCSLYACGEVDFKISIQKSKNLRKILEKIFEKV